MSTVTVKERTGAAPASPLGGLHPVLAKILSVRGVKSTSDVDYNLKQLLPATTLKQLDRMVERLCLALKEQQRITIIGDFDADGATSSALAVSALKSFGAEHVSTLVPNRFEYGYGLTPEIVDIAHQEHQPTVIITVDNGIASIEGVAQANALGIDVLVTDHHLPGEVLPEAYAIVNPNQDGCDFPSGALAGVGVIFYVMCALRTELRTRGWFAEQQRAEPNMGQFLDLVALGTVADVVPLDVNNRILVHQGLQRIRAGAARPGIKALLAVSGRDAEHLTAADLGFSLGPRLNAAGRLTDMTIGINMLLSDDFGQALTMAHTLDDLNKERRRIEQEMHGQAMTALAEIHPERLSAQEKQYGYCFYHQQWHQGVIGILAGRLKEKLHRPVIAFANSGAGQLKGSARSIPGIHIRDVLADIAKATPTMLSKFGGHAMAAGLSLQTSDLAAFTLAFDHAVKAQCQESDLGEEILTDGCLSANEFTLSFAQLLRDAGPWGQNFPEPSFQGEFMLIDQRLVGSKHLKMTLGLPGTRIQLDAIAFNINPSVWPDHRRNKINCVYQLDINFFNGVQRLQLLVRHIQ